MSTARAVDLAALPREQLSVIERIALLPREERRRIYSTMTEDEARALIYDWLVWARPDQLPPRDFWRLWLVITGRGTGKTRTGAEWVRVRGPQGRVGMLVAANPRDARDLMIEGPSGILTVSPPGERPIYEPSKLLLTWPNGAIAHVRSAEDPEGLRGPSVDWAWCDEFAKWRYILATWNNLRFGLREGTNPQTLVTTTPQPTMLLKELLGYPINKPPKIKGTVIAPRVSTFRNAANLSGEFLEEMIEGYEGTRIGRQELYGELLEDVEGALVKVATLEANRIEPTLDAPDPIARLMPRLARVVVAVDPSWGTKGNEVGIVVAGADQTRHGYTLADYSGRMEPLEWGRKMVWAYHHWGADVLVAETNFQAAQVELVLKAVMAEDTRPVNFKEKRVSRGKVVRAEPVAALHEQGRWHHVGRFPELEQQWTEWVPGTEPEGWSPDRLDAEVFAADELLLQGGPASTRSSARETLPKPVINRTAGGRQR